MTIRVSYDAQAFRIQNRGGISRYFAELAGAFRSDPSLGVEPIVRLRLAASEHLHDIGLGRHWVVHPQLLRYAEPILPSGPRRHSGADLVHHTYYFPKALSGTWHIPRVSTIHDMIPELMPEYFPHGNPHQAKREYVRVSRGLIFVSETTRRDLTRIYGLPDVPTAVAHLAPGKEFYPRQGPALGEHRYVLYVGQRSGYKEFDTLLRALSGVRSRSLALIAVGGGQLNEVEEERIRSLGLAGRVRQCSPGDDELAELYSGADALVVPSRHEGFGLPLVEAMASGCPIAVSDIDVFHEIAEDVAHYFPVGDFATLAALLDRLHGDSELRRTSRDAGLVRVRDFDWLRTARTTARLYREVLSQ